jgi:hypothetical protein
MRMELWAGRINGRLRNIKIARVLVGPGINHRVTQRGFTEDKELKD